MISRLHDKLGTAGLIVAVIALVAAVAGTALAAGGLTKQQEKQVKKIAKKFAGKDGAPGTQGPQGNPGANGAAGKDGSNGTNGIAGKSVLASAASGAECSEGGTKFEVEGSGITRKVCNGEEGPEGPPGEPWPVGGTLPEGATETGTWGGAFKENDVGLLPIGIPIPMAAAPQATALKPSEPSATGCPGIVNGVPTAEAGNLCLYTGLLAGTLTNEGFLKPDAAFNPGTAAEGTIFSFQCASAECFIYGSWAAAE